MVTKGMKVSLRDPIGIQGTTVLGTGDPNMLDYFDLFMFNVTPAHPHPDSSQAPHSPDTGPAPPELFSLLSTQLLGQRYRSGFTRQSRFPYLSPKKPEEPQLS